MVLPLPVLPTIAVVSPGRAWNEIVVQDRLLGAGVAELDVAELDQRRGRAAIGQGDRLVGIAMAGSVSRTSWIRPAETVARGIEDEHEHRGQDREQDLGRYWRNAVRSPICSSPRSTRIAPNQITATVERLKIAVIVGIVIANSRFTWSEVVEQVAVGDVEALLLVPGPHEGADDADAGERLAHDLVDPVELDLDGPEQRDRPAT